MGSTKRGSGSARALYLSYDGIGDDIGQSQVLPYLLGCAGKGHRITLVSFEKPGLADAARAAIAKRLRVAGIDWRPQRFRNKPPLIAKLLDQRTMIRAARAVIREAAAQGDPYDFIHARSYVAAHAAQSATSTVPLLFDMRGFWVDQRREGGRWTDTSLVGRRLYRRWKAIEAQLIARAQQIVVLTDAARDVVASMPAYRGQPLPVVPCAADFTLFPLADAASRAAARERFGIDSEALVLTWLGSLGTVYRGDVLLAFFDRLQQRYPEATLLLIGHQRIDRIVADAAALGLTIRPESIRQVALARADVPAALAAADLGACFIVPRGSSAGVSPTKVGEMLACGLPVIANNGIGDLEVHLRDTGGGVCIDVDDRSALDLAVDEAGRLRGADRGAIRERARAIYDLDSAIAAYDAIYRSMVESRSDPTA